MSLWYTAVSLPIRQAKFGGKLPVFEHTCRFASSPVLKVDCSAEANAKQNQSIKKEEAS